MRHSLNEIYTVEKFLSRQLMPGENLLFEARLLTNPPLRINVALQAKIHSAVKCYHRKQLKLSLKEIHNELFSDPRKKSFQREIIHYFNKPL
jgi:hypothetical protein